MHLCSYRRNFPSESLAAYNRTRPYCTCPHPVRPASRHKTLKSQETSVRASLARARRPTARAPAAAAHARRRRLSPRLATQAAAAAGADLRAPHRRASVRAAATARGRTAAAARTEHTHQTSSGRATELRRRRRRSPPWPRRGARPGPRPEQALTATARPPSVGGTAARGGVARPPAQPKKYMCML